MCAEAFPVAEQAKAVAFAGIDRKGGAKRANRDRARLVQAYGEVECSTSLRRFETRVGFGKPWNLMHSSLPSHPHFAPDRRHR
jgi:hypothetical protein